MDPRKVLAIGAVLFASAGAASAGVIFSDFVAANGFDADNSIPIFNIQPFPPTTDSKSTFVAVPFQVPPGLSYILTEIDVAVSEPNGGGPLFVNLMGPRSGNGEIFSAAVPVGSGGIISIHTPVAVLDPGTYSLQLSIFDPKGEGAAVNWHQNSAGVDGTFTTSSFPNNDPNSPPIVSSRNGRLPAFRILGDATVLGDPTSSPSIAPAYSAFATVDPGQAAYATIEIEVICPGPIPQFTCPVGVSLQAGETPAQVCGDVAAAINQFAATAPLGSCWPLPNVVVDPSQFHADCDGDSVRITNSTPGLCNGAFVCVDGLNNLTKFAALPRQRTLAYEYDSVSGPLVLDFSGTVSGIAGDLTHPSGIQLVHRRILTGQTFVANVHLPAGSTPSQIGNALAAALVNDVDQVSATPTGLRFLAREPYDVTLRVNDSSLSWALSPFTDLLARSSLSTNPAPVVQPTCAGGPTRLCLQHGRFQVEATWHIAQGASGDGLVANANDESGSFSFFDGANVELIAKVINACDFFHSIWFFAAGATNVGVDLKVTDTLTGQVHIYHNAAGTPFQSIFDITTFRGCPLS